MATTPAAAAAAMEAPARSVSGRLKTLPGAKDLRVACSTCTFLNASEAETCEMCGAKMAATAHEVQADGSWKCGSCATVNGKGVRACCECRLPFYARVTSAAPSQILCPRCGFLNDGGNAACVQCDAALRSALERLGTDLRDSTNFLARDMGVSIHVKCPGCLLECLVPPATAGLRCGACHTYFASPSVGEATNFHVTRLASSISSSVMGLFGQRQAPPATDAPVGRLLALGKELVKSPRHRLASPRAAASRPVEERQAATPADLEEEKGAAPDPQVATRGADAAPGGETVGASSASPQRTARPSPPPPPPPPLALPPATGFTDCGAKAGAGGSASFPPRPAKREPLPPMARSLPVREALPAPPQHLIQVEGEIVEL